MAIGQLDRQIILANYTETADAVGYMSKSWTDAATVWAKVVTQSGTEGQDNQQEIARSRVMFTIRFRNDITIDESTRIEYKSDYYDIVSIKEIGREEYLELTATKRDNQ